MLVLLVEDSPTQAEIAKGRLEARGAAVEVTPTLAEALQRLRQPGVDVILLDLTLPDSTGLETFYRVRASSDVPVVIWTGDDNAEMAMRTMKKGAQDYLIKGKTSDDSVMRVLNYAIERSNVEKALVRSEKRLRILLENTYDAFISMDSHWHITDWNTQAERTFGWTRAEVLGRPLAMIVPPHLRRKYTRDLTSFFMAEKDAQARLTDELICVHHDGHEFPIEMGIFRVKGDDDFMYCAFGRDISERRRMAVELEQRVQERTEELTRSNEELNQFAKIASHDLQEPLRAVQGFINLLQESTRGQLNQDCEEYMEYILDGTQRMQQLIQAVLLHSSISAENSHNKEVPLTDCGAALEEVLANLDASIKESEAVLEVDYLPEVAVDRSQLIQLFQNLISNAIKYRGEEAPQIYISAERTVDEWLFSVRDNGIGIEAKYADQIFDMFARLHGKTKYKGTGMGLAICKKIVNLHGGRIWVESELGQGCIFLFTLPAASKPLRRVSMESNIEILLVEDTPSDVRLTQEALKRSELKYTLTVVNDGVEAMELLHSLKDTFGKKLPDIILLDLNMPRKNGHEVLHEISQDPKLKEVPVVLLTVSQRDEDVMEALRTKMNFYLAKPVTSNKLSVLLRAIFVLQSGEIVERKPMASETHVRLVLAGNPHTAHSILGRLATDENYKIRVRVAENPETPEHLLKELAGDKHYEVRIGVSENPHVSQALLEQLAGDENDDVRLAIAGNKLVPTSILARLVDDPNTFVSASATKTLASLASGSVA